MSQDGDPLRHLPPIFRVLAALLDAMADDWQEWRVLGLVETAILRDRPLAEREGWNPDRTQREMARWGAVDQDGIYRAAGLNATQTRVAFLHFDRQFQPHEIAELLGMSDGHAASVRLYEAREKLKKLAARDNER